jgi:hypothetical protein
VCEQGESRNKEKMRICKGVGLAPCNPSEVMCAGTEPEFEMEGTSLLIFLLWGDQYRFFFFSS